MDKTYNFEDRLVQFAGEIIFFCATLPEDTTARYYGNQVMRSSGSSALNYGEAQGTTTPKDFIHRMTLVLRELRESKVSLRILDYVKYGDETKRKKLLEESNELAAISAKMILNAKEKLKK